MLLNVLFCLDSEGTGALHSEPDQEVNNISKNTVYITYTHFFLILCLHIEYRYFMLVFFIDTGFPKKAL